MNSVSAYISLMFIIIKVCQCQSGRTYNHSRTRGDFTMNRNPCGWRFSFYGSDARDSPRAFESMQRDCPFSSNKNAPRPQQQIYQPNKVYKPNTNNCQDSHPLCCFWATMGQCDANMNWMRPNCQYACGTCGCTRANVASCVVKLGNCGTTKVPLIQTSANSIATPPTIAATKPPATPAPSPTQGLVSTRASYGTCNDNHELCCFWATMQQCDMNPNWMRVNCQNACGTCGCTLGSASTCKVQLGNCGPTGPPYTGTSARVTTPLSASGSPGAGTPTSVQTTADNSGDQCADSNELCCFWASLGHCDSNLFWMRPNCQKACGTCGCSVENPEACPVDVSSHCVASDITKSPKEVTARPPPALPTTELYSAATSIGDQAKPTPGPAVDSSTFNGVCVDTDDMCCFWASLGHCDSNMFWMRPYCQRACGTCGCAIDNAPDCKVTQTECMAPQQPPHSDANNNRVDEIPAFATGVQPQVTEAHSEHTEEELQQTTAAGSGSTSGSQTGGSGCEDTNELCCFWASIGHCDSNKYWMRPYCQKSCGTCGCTEEDAENCQVSISDGCQETTLAPFTRPPQTTYAAVYSSQATIRQMPYQALNGGSVSEGSAPSDIEPSPPAPNADTVPTAVTNPVEVPTKAVVRVLSANAGSSNTNEEQSYNAGTGEKIGYPGFQPQAPPSVPSAPAPRPYGSMKQKVSPYLKYKGGTGNDGPLLRAGYFRMKNDAGALLD